MTVHRQVQKINDFLFMIVPGSCPDDDQTHCDSCKYSTVKFKKETRALRSEIQMGYVSCSCLASQMPRA